VNGSKVGRAALAGIIGPAGFLAVSFLMAALRGDVIRAQGWASWPSSMSLGGAAGVPEILAFLLLAASYPIFAFGAVRPSLDGGLAWRAFLGVAAGDLLLAFPTDAPNAGTSWHGVLHIVGVLVVTLATLVAGVAVTTGTSSRPSWRPWRFLGAPVLVAAVVIGFIGFIGGFEHGWAKVTYVLGITLPVPLIAVLIRRDVRAAHEASAKS
jgi:hypothetical protein